MISTRAVTGLQKMRLQVKMKGVHFDSRADLKPNSSELLRGTAVANSFECFSDGFPKSSELQYSRVLMYFLYVLIPFLSPGGVFKITFCLQAEFFMYSV